MEGLAALLGGLLMVGGPLVWALLLNRRDRRETRLLQTVLDQLRAPELRGRVAVRVRCGVLSPRRRARVHVVSDSHAEVWELLRRLSERLSPRVRLDVTGPVDRTFLATLILDPA